MKKLNDFGIGTRMSVFINVAVVLILALLGVYIYHIQHDKIIADTDANMTEQVEDLCKMVRLQIMERQGQMQAAMNMADELFTSSGNLTLDESNRIEVSATDQITHNTRRIQIPSLLLNGEPIHGDTSLVDKITSLTGAKATIFQKIDGGYLRISTSVLKAGGSRAVDTYLPDDSPVLRAVKRGQDFIGRAYVVSDWYITVYRPLSVNGEILALLFVGMPEKDMEHITQLFNSKTFLQSGYPFIIDKEGQMVVHPVKDETIHKKDEFFRKLTEAKSETGKIAYKWEGEKKVLYFKYLPEIESYIAATLYKDEMTQILRHIRNVLFLSVLLSIGIILLITTYISKTISGSVNKSVEFAKRIAKGDLTAELDIDQEDEIGVLAKSLSQMVDKLREIVTVISRGAVDMASASQQISSGSQQLSQGASSQAGAAEEVSSSMEQMAASIQQSTDNAVQTEKISVKAKEGMDLMRISGKKSISSIKELPRSPVTVRS